MKRPGDVIALSQIEVLPPARQSSLPTIVLIILAFELAALIVARLLRSRFVGLANWLDTRRSILLSLFVYSLVACWGFLLNATVEFWMLALMVAMVQGGSQALSRSLYASLCPTSQERRILRLLQHHGEVRLDRRSTDLCLRRYRPG